MNAKWLDKMAEYRHTKEAFESSKNLIFHKILYQIIISKNLKDKEKVFNEIKSSITAQELLLIEARYAKKYWSFNHKELALKTLWNGRTPHGKDPYNQLLDVGYHFLVGYLQKECEAIDMPTELGILHRAHSQKSHPLVYDLMEWLRPFLVDKVVFTYFRKKKILNKELKEGDVAKCVAEIHKKLDSKFYHHNLKYCIALSYFIRLYLLSFRKAVSGGTVFKFSFPSLRHESRCKIKTP